MRRRLLTVLAALLVPLGLVVPIVAAAEPAGAADAAVIEHCYLPPHDTSVHWDRAVLERKYGITVQVTRVTFWWYIASRGGYVNGTGTIDGDNARAETLTGATSVYAVLTFSNTQGFTTLPGTCAAV